MRRNASNPLIVSGLHVKHALLQIQHAVAEAHSLPLRLFRGAKRIQIRMSATFTHARLQSAGAGTFCDTAFGTRSSTLGSLATAPRSTFLFLPLLADDTKTL